MAVLQEAATSPIRLGNIEPGGWWRRIGRGVLLPLGFAVLATVGWEILCRMARISPLLLPPPSAVWAVLSENYAILFQQALPTTIETVVSFGLATLLGIALAVAITFSAWIREALYPNIVMFQLIPKIALAPLFIVWLGVGSKSCIVVAVFIAFFPVVVSTATGLVSAKPEVLMLCRLAHRKRMADISSGAVSLCDAVCLCRDEGRRDDGDDRRHCRRIHHCPGRAWLHHHVCLSAGETATVLAAIVLLCGIGLALYGIVALGELAMQRWYGGEMPVGGVI